MVSDSSSKRLTIYDLARLAETSPSTVSAVLNGTWQRRRISKKLASKILSSPKRKAIQPTCRPVRCAGSVRGLLA
ncbi:MULTISPECIES: LacI family DNA-binding transcriptional regulator [Halomonas]|uniref:LacI family DNA-binding transcriptional regulator n=1 Tax=Halomonas sp. R57-5 TaxID=1610576 RepID=UPI000AD023F7